MANLYLAQKNGAHNVFRTVVPSWDNTARRGRRALIGLNGTPETTNIGYQNRLGGRARNFPGRIASYSSTLGMNGPKAAISSLAGGMVSAFLRRRSTPSTAGPNSIRSPTSEYGRVAREAAADFCGGCAAWVLRHLKTQAQTGAGPARDGPSAFKT